jgi:hypothetical protein
LAGEAVFTGNALLMARSRLFCRLDDVIASELLFFLKAYWRM